MFDRQSSEFPQPKLWAMGKPRDPPSRSYGGQASEKARPEGKAGEHKRDVQDCKVRTIGVARRTWRSVERGLVNKRPVPVPFLLIRKVLFLRAAALSPFNCARRRSTVFVCAFREHEGR